MAKFDIDAALKEGYTAAEINDYIGQQSGFDVDAARKEGYADSEILQHFMPAAPKERTWGEAATDSLKQVGAGINSIAGAVPNLIDPTSETSQFFNRGTEHWNNEQSDAMKSMLAKREMEIQTAAKNGEWDAFKTALSTALSDPAIASKIVFETLPSMIPVIGAGKAATLIAEAAKVAPKAAAWLQRGTMAATNAGLTAGDARQGAYEDLNQTYKASGMLEEEASQRALDESRKSAAVGAGFGLLGGAFGAEANILGKTIGKTATGRAVNALGMEVGTELGEETAPLVTTNLIAGEVDNRDWSKNVGRTAADTMIGVGPMATMGAISAARNVDEAIDAAARSLASPETAAEVDAGTGAAFISGVEASKEQLDTLNPARQLAAPVDPANPTLSVTPDGIVATPTQAEAIASYPTTEQALTQEAAQAELAPTEAQDTRTLPIAREIPPSTPAPVTGSRQALADVASVVQRGEQDTQTGRATIALARRLAGNAAVEQQLAAPFTLTKTEQNERAVAATPPITITPNANGVPIVKTETQDQQIAVVQALRDAGIKTHTVDGGNIRLNKNTDMPVVQSVVARVNTRFTPSRNVVGDTANQLLDLENQIFPTIEGTETNGTQATQAEPLQAGQQEAPVATPAADIQGLLKTKEPVYEITDLDTLPTATAALGGKRMSQWSAKTIKTVAGLFGRKVRFYETADKDAAEGINNDRTTLYINVDGNVDLLAVAGHEFVHSLEYGQESNETYVAALNAVKALIKANPERAAKYREYYGKKDMSEDALAREVLSDIGGNEWRSAKFWGDVFDQVAAQHPPSVARTIITKLRDAIVAFIDKLVKATPKQGFALDTIGGRVKDGQGFTKAELLEIRALVVKASADAMLRNTRERMGLQKPAAMDAEGEVRTAPRRPEFTNQTLPTRWPTAAGANPSVNDDMITDLATLKQNEKQYEKAVNAIIEEPGMHSPDIVSGSLDDKAEHIIGRMMDNLLWLFDQVPMAIRERSKLWYDGARKISEAWAKKYDISESQAAGALAVLSPQKDWFMNVTMAERVLDIMHTKMSHTFDKKMDAAAFGFLTKESLKTDPDSQKNLNAYEAVKGKTLREVADVGDLRQLSVWIRSYDEAYHDAKHAIVTPEGGFVEDKTTVKGEPTMRAWGDFTTPGKAASIYLDGTPENINKQLGGEHKVRNFYNNIYAPQDARFTTIDTHAVAADMLRALAGASKAVAENFGKTGGTNATGLSGTYALHYEAYRRAAEARGVLPREMQSITWEAVRGLFTEGFKGKAENVKAIDDIWRKVDSGDLTIPQARDEILQRAGGIANPDWWQEGNADYEAVLRDKSYVPDRGSFGGVKVTFEVAPDPRNTELKARWDALPAEVKSEITRKVAWKVAAKGLASFGDENMKGELHSQSGGWMADTNPSLSIWFNKRAAASKISDFARMLGHALRQEGMMRTSLKPFKGADGKKVEESRAIGITLPEGTDAATVYDKLRELTDDNGTPYVSGHTSTTEQMVIIHSDEGSITGESLGQKIADLLGDEYTVTEGPIYAEFPSKGDNDYGFSGQELTEDSPESSLRARADQLRAEADVLIDQLIGESDATGGGRIRASSQRVSYGSAQEGSSSVEGLHYSGTQRAELDSSKYGSGMRGAERVRLNRDSASAVQRKRLHFYVNEGSGVTPESGVGYNAHAVKLNNLYDWTTDTLGLWDKAREQYSDRADMANWVEQYVVAHGFDGIYAKGAQGKQGVAVLIGDHKVAVDYLGMGKQETEVAMVGEDVRFSLRRKPAPEKTEIGYKLMRVKVGKAAAGQLYPLFMDKGVGAPLGVWLDADFGKGAMADRPGWHLGETPYAGHIGGDIDPATNAPTTRLPEQVWVETEYAADVDWQPEANRRGTNKKGAIVPSKADIKDQIPTDGYYRYKTNTNMDGDWIISGSIKLNRILSDEEVAEINAKAGHKNDLPRKEPRRDFTEKFSTARFNTPEFKRWFKGSQIKNADGSPKIMYHGTARDITEFIPKQAKAIFLSPDPEFADDFAQFSQEWKAKHNVRDGVGMNILPVVVRAENPFDMDNEEHIAAMEAALGPRWGEGKSMVRISDVANGGWSSIEHPITQQYIRDNHDSFYVYEGGRKNLAVFEPNQVKSASGNSGAYGETGDIRYSPGRQPWYFSKLEESIDKAPKSFKLGKQWDQWVAGGKLKELGVKQEEIEWSGLRDYLKMRAEMPTTADDVRNFLKNNNVKVKDVMLDNGDVFIAEDIEDSMIVGQYDVRWRGDGFYAEGMGSTEGPMDEQEMADFLNEYTEDSSNRAKFKDYTLPGGENYKELLVTLPVKPSTTFSDYAKKYREVFDTEKSDSELRSMWESGHVLSGSGSAKSNNFTSSHFDQPNILAHLRFNERTDASGAKVLFIEEIQSDWGQKGKNEGFAKDGLPTGYSVEKKSGFSLTNPGTVWGFKHDDPVWGETVTGEYQSEEEARKAAWSHSQGGNRGNTPTAPFVTDTKSWTSLALKRAIAYAVDNGFSKIAWTTGEQQAARYDLSKEIKQILVRPFGDKWSLKAYDKGDSARVSETLDDLSQIDEYIGKDAGDKARQQIETDGSADLRGLDLKVGGEGMKGYYDGIVPQVAKKLGLQVGTVAIENTDEFKTESFADFVDRTGLDEGEARRRYMENRSAVTPAPLQQPGFTIPDSMKQQVADKGLALFSPGRSALTGQPINQSWVSNGIFTKRDGYIEKLQDKLISTKRIVAEIRKAGIAIRETFDPYLQEILYHGRAANRVKEFLDNEMKPMLMEMHARGIEMQEMEDYLWARHAGERNAQIAKVNPNMPDGGSGLTNREAADLLMGQPVVKNGRTMQLRTAKMAGYQSIAAKVKAINAKTLAELVADGLETQATVDAWKATYGDYVPLKRDMESDDNYAGAFNLGMGQGFSVKGSASKRAMGSKRGVIDILANVAMQRERAITRGEKNKVAMAAYGLALTAPNPDFWIPINGKAPVQDIIDALVKMGLSPQMAKTYADNLAQTPTTQTVNSQGVVTNQSMPLLMQRPDVLAVRINGQDRFLMFSSDERAQHMVRNLKNLDAEQLGEMMSRVATVTRYFSSVNTQYNPVFGLTNGIRDLGTGMLNLSSTPLKGQRAKVARYAFDALRGIYADLRDHRKGIQPTSRWALEFEEFQREGGQTGYRDMFADSAERTKGIMKELENAGKGQRWLAVGEKNSHVFGWLSDYNTAIENAVRLAAYKAAKEDGMSVQQAAALAKGLTVNFNKKGLAATQTGALYAFFNAAVQGTARIGETMTVRVASTGNPLKDISMSDVGKKIAYGGVMLGVMQAVMAALAGWDDEEPAQYLREKNFIIPTPDGKYFAIPLPLGYHVLTNLGRIPAELMFSGFKKPGERMVRMAAVVMDAFNPLGSSSILQTFTPTIIDPIAAMSENKDFTGKSIFKEDFSKMKPTAGWTRTKDTASDFSKAMAYGINYVTGGGKYEIGLASPTPDQIDYLIGQATGGVGRETLKLWQAAKTPVTGEELPMYKIPVVGRFAGETTGTASETSRFYDNLKRIGEHASALKEMEEAKDGQARMIYLRDNPDARMVAAADKASRELGYLKRMKRDALERGEKEKVKAMEERIKTTVARWNERLGEKQN